MIVLSIFLAPIYDHGRRVGAGRGPCQSSLALIVISPSIMGVDGPTIAPKASRHLIQAQPLFPLENPGILSIPLGFLGAIIGTLLSHEPASQEKFNELMVRSNTGLGAEKATA